MRYLYLAIHHLKPEYARDLLAAMEELGRVLRSAAGVIEAAAWRESDGRTIVATSVWESPSAFQSALPLIGAAVKDVPFDRWEDRPRELLRATEIETGARRS